MVEVAGRLSQGGKPRDGAAETRRFNIDEVLLPITEQRVRQLPRLAFGALRLAWDAARRLVVVSVVLQLAGSVGLAAQLLFGKRLLVAIQDGAGHHLGSIEADLAVLTAATAGLGFAGLARWELVTPLAEAVARHAMGKVLDVAASIDLLAYETPEFHDRLQRATVNAQSRPTQMTTGLLSVVGSLAGVVGIGAAILILQPLFFLAVVVAYVPIWLATIKASRVLYQWTVEQTERDRRRIYLQAVLSRKDEAKEVRSYHLAPHLRQRYEELYDARLRDLGIVARKRLAAGLAGSVATAALSIGAVGLLVYMVGSGRLSVAGAGAAAAGIVLLSTQLRSLAAGVGQLYQSSLFIADFNSFVASMPSPPRGAPTSGPASLGGAPTSGSAPPRSFDCLRAEDVWFTYPSQIGPSLRGVNIEIRAGEVVALVGENGSGKTTLAKIMAGLYRPGRGRVAWDGADVSRFDPAAYRDRCAVLFQDFVRYQLTARDNIAFGRWWRPHGEHDIVEAARRAGAHSFVSGLPGAYDAWLGPEFLGAVDLSGGQWQRLALARSFFRDAPFVILDEPTAALDPRSEAELFDSVRQLFRTRAVLLISHRFSSVRNADRIYVLHEGRVVEAGSHDQLMSREGRYADLFMLQAAAFVT